MHGSHSGSFSCLLLIEHESTTFAVDVVDSASLLLVVFISDLVEVEVVDEVVVVDVEVEVEMRVTWVVLFFKLFLHTFCSTRFRRFAQQ